MNNAEDTTAVRNQLNEIFRDVFSDDSIELADNMTAEDIPGWDSIAHINLLIAIERHFGIKFATAEMSGMKAQGQDVGAFCRLVESKVRVRK